MDKTAAIVAGAVVVGLGVYLATRPKAAVSPAPTPAPAVPPLQVVIPQGTITTAPVVGSITTLAQWLALTPTAQAAYVQSLGVSMQTFLTSTTLPAQGMGYQLPGYLSLK